MRKRVSIKIFCILMIAFILILGISANLNIDAQKNVYSQWIQEKYNFGEISKKITDLFKEFGIESSQESPQKYEKADVLKVVHNSEFKKELQSICPLDWNYIYLVSNDFQTNTDKIELYTLGTDYLDNYIRVYNETKDQTEDVSIGLLPTSTKEELLTLLKKGLYTNQHNGYSSIEVKFQIIDNKLVYLECRDILFGEKTDVYNEGRISSFCIQGQSQVYDPLRQIPILANTDEIKKVVETLRTYAGVGGGYVSYFKEVGKKTYFITNVGISEGTESYRFSASIISVVDGINDYVIDRYIEENSMLYIWAFFISVIISIIFSYMISKPIKKVEKAALKIASQDFDEPLIIKSKDEIGSLAKSVDSMRVQLKETIENLQQEINKVKNLESLRKDFINQFTHEMKTPLGIINGYSELIEESKNEEEVNKYLNIINRETNRVNELIQSMLKLSRLEAKKVELNKQDIDLEESVISIVDEYEVLLMKKNIKVEVNVIQSTINADKKLIGTVIHNFLSNAIKHTDMNHKIIINIDNGVSIFNEGKPIDDDKIENIWYTFVTHDREGSGLGLAICRSILDLHEFKYGVENKENGVCFTFTTKAPIN